MLLHDLILLVFTLLLGATLLLLIRYIFFTHHDINVLNRAKTRIKRQGYLIYVKVSALYKKWKASRRKPQIPENDHELELIRE